jgi:hypothetical protein
LAPQRPAGGAARRGRISKRVSPAAGWALVEAAWTAVLPQGPLHCFYECVTKPPRSRQGDRRHRRQALDPLLVHAHPLRGLRPPTTLPNPKEAPPPGAHRRRSKYTRRAAGVWSTNDLMRDTELELANQAETPYKRMVQDQLAGAPSKKAGASVTLQRA